MSNSAVEEKRSKYGATAVVVEGIRFASKREANRYLVLKNDRDVRDLKVQPAWRIEINGEFICDYVGDFSYRRVLNEEGNRTALSHLIVEDVKSKATKTPEYRIKKKLMSAVHHIDVAEVA